MKSVLLLSSVGRFPGGFPGEVWGVNRSYRLGVPQNRHFVMDHLWEVEREGGNEAYASDLAALGIPVIMQRHHPEIPLSEANPTDRIAADLGVDYFTSSFAYMLSRAIWEGYERIVLNKVLCGRALEEYIQQKPCLDGWLMYAKGRGIEIHQSAGSMLMKPYPWQPKRYGYHETDQRPVKILADAVKEIMKGPIDG